MVRGPAKEYLAADVWMIYFGHELHIWRGEGIVVFQVHKQLEIASFKGRVGGTLYECIKCPVVLKYFDYSNLSLRILLITPSVTTIPLLASLSLSLFSSRTFYSAT